jgi:hypothetical protein
MKSVPFLLILAMSQTVYCQNYPLEKRKIDFNLKKEYPSIITSLLAGALEGTAETLKWHYSDFAEAFPKANKQFWNPQYSWDNKYKNGQKELGPKFFGANTFLVWTTDGYHAMRFSRNVLLTTTLALHPMHKKKKWYSYAFDLAVHTLAFQVGFHSTYSLAFKR